jgi:hypothetical protein
VYESAHSPVQEVAANLLGVMTDDEELAESWYRKADQNDPGVRAALLEVQGKRLRREGKLAECAAKFADAAKAHLALAASSHSAGYNNAAVANEMGFACSGDPQALRDAVAALEIAYRNTPDDPIVAGNLAMLLDSVGELRVLARHLDVRALRFDQAEVSDVIVSLLDSSERAAFLGELVTEPSIRRGSEVLAQFEVLAPNNPLPYRLRFTEAERKHDAGAAAAVVERARTAKGIDVSETTAAWDRWLAGTDDAKYLASLENTRARLDAALARSGLDPKTRAAGLRLMSRALAKLGLYRSDAAVLGRARDAASQAMRLWPALDGNGLIAITLLDEAGLSGDAKAWIAARRARSAAAVLDKLDAAHAPLAAKIRASTQWAELATYAKADTRTPDIDDLRLARLIADPALEARSKAALDDKLGRLTLELAIVLDPASATAKEDLAYFDKR